MRHLGIGLLPYSPVHASLLGGALQAATDGRISDDSTLNCIEPHRDQLEAYEGLCQELGAKPVDVALAWLLRNPVVSSAIVGALTIEELHADLGALSLQLDASRNGSTGSGRDRGKPRRPTPGNYDEQFHFAPGDHDAFVVAKPPDNTSATAFALPSVRRGSERTRSGALDA